MESKIPSEFINGKKIKKEETSFQGHKKITEYILGQRIGKGGFSICYKCWSVEDNTICVAKEIIEEKTSVERLRNEILLYGHIDSEYIVKLLDDFLFENKEYLIFEFCENKDLNSLLKNRKRLKEIEVQYYIYYLIEALIHLHERNIIHRDITLKNIFLTKKMELKLGDLGLAKRLSCSNEECHDVVGTVHFMAPELFENKSYTFTADIWPIGVIMYNLLVGYPPFSGKDEEETKKKIINVDYKFPEDIKISKAAKDLIKQILVKEPEKRPSLHQILQHDFFHLGSSIPKKLNKKFIDNPPSENYIRNFMKDADDDGIVDREVTTTNLKDMVLDRNEDRNIQNNNKNKFDVYIVQCREIKKYGLGYQLSDRSYGVCFNDSSKILQSQPNKFFYIESKDDGDYYEANNPNLPKDIQKKYNILQGFINILSYKDKNSSVSLPQNEANADNESVKYEKIFENRIYVKAYYALDDRSILLRMNNKTIQIYFFNGEIILLSKEEKEVTFIKKNREKLETMSYQLDEIIETQDFEMIRKLQYSKSLLERILSKEDNKG